MNKRLFELDALRGLAALSVALYHFTTQYDNVYGHAKENFSFQFKYGAFGVQLFFIISGFVIFMSMKNIKSLKEFAIKRFIRIYPAYFFAVTLTFTIVSLCGLPGKDVTLPQAIINLSMLQSFAGIAHIDGVYWSLTAEIIFYGFIGTVFSLGLLPKIDHLSYLWLVTSGLIITLTSFTQSGLLDLLAYGFVVHYCNLFIAGIMFYKLKEEQKTKYHVLLLACLIFEFVFNGLTSGIIVLLFFILFYALVYNKIRLPNYKVFAFLGSISYALYLVHQIIGYVIIHFLESHGLTQEYIVIVPLLVAIVLATALTYWIEKPIQNAIKRKFPQSKRSTSPTIEGVSYTVS